MAVPLEALPEPPREPIVLTIRGDTVVIEVDDPAWPVAEHAREVDVDLRNAEKSLRGLRSALTKARKDEAVEAEKKRLGHPQREMIFRVFDVWRVESGRTRCKLTPERFDMTAARVAEDYDEGALTMAAIGVATNPYVIDGEKKNDFETAFQSGSQIERYANRCPPDRRRQLSGRLFE